MELLFFVAFLVGGWTLYSYAADRREQRMAERFERMRRQRSAQEAAEGASAEIDAAIAAAQVEAERARAFAGRHIRW